MNHFYQHIPSQWSDFLDVYQMAVQRAPSPAVFVELGVFLGKSAAFMAVEIANSGKAIEFHCVDKWSPIQDNKIVADTMTKTDGFEAFKTFMTRGGVWDRIIAHKMDSAEAAGLFADQSVDFCFVDAEHNYDSVARDLRAWLPKMKPGGLLAGHDFNPFWHPAVVQAVDAVLGDKIRVQGKSWLYFVP